ncbi:Snmp2 [Trypoxylus dichotomus]
MQAEHCDKCGKLTTEPHNWGRLYRETTEIQKNPNNVNREDYLLCLWRRPLQLLSIGKAFFTPKCKFEFRNISQCRYCRHKCYYIQTRQKRNITYNEANDTLTYEEYMYFEFDAEKSYPNSENDTVVVVNAALNVLFNMLSSIFPENLQYLIDKTWQNVFPDTETLFHTVQVGDILFNGYRFCDPQQYQNISAIEDFAWLVCSTFRLLNVPVLETEDDGSLNFAFFKWKQGKHSGVFNIGAGIKDVSKLGLIHSWNGYFYLDMWKGQLSSCNKVRGRDSVLYQPFLKEDEEVDIFAVDICRVSSIYYVRDEEVLNIKGQRRKLREDTFSISQNSGNECFCTDTVRDLYGEQKCLPDGFFDLQPCFGAPIVGSFPHFLYGDDNYTSTVRGLNPNEESHETYAILEPITGTPLAGYKRIQFNAILKPLQGVNVTQVRNTMLPILWVEEGVEINDELADIFKSKFLNVLQAAEILKWVLIGVGGAVFIGFGSNFTHKMEE